MEKSTRHDLFSGKINSPYIAEIVDKISGNVEFKTYHRGHRFVFGGNRKEQVYIIRSGIASLHRQPDDILLRYCEAPSIRGLVVPHADPEVVNKNWPPL